MLALVASVLPLAGMQLHCAGPTGAIIGLTSDNTYNVRLPPDAPANEEKWTRVDYTNPPVGQTAIDGSYAAAWPSDYLEPHTGNSASPHATTPQVSWLKGFNKGWPCAFG